MIDQDTLKHGFRPGQVFHMPERASAAHILGEASRSIGNRASERDLEEERSMARTVRAFNAMYGTDLSELQGWQFMVLLKMSRGSVGRHNIDDYIDQAAYAALAGECADNRVGQANPCPVAG